MNAVTEHIAEIAVITDDNGTAELIDAACAELGIHLDSESAVVRFRENHVSRWASAATAEAKLLDHKRGEEPELIVLDIMVRRETRGGNPGNGVAGLALLDWLGKTRPLVPVIVLAAEGVDCLEARLLRRPQIASVSIGDGDFSIEFARALLSLNGSAQKTSPHISSATSPAESRQITTLAVVVPPAAQPPLASSSDTPSSSRRRITVQVGQHVARYIIEDGYRTSTSGYHQYASPKFLEKLGKRTDAFKPRRPTWQKTIGELGSAVFELIIADTIGPHILMLLRGIPVAEGETPPCVDLRFEILIPRNETALLFGVPFELAKPPEDIDNYLCTRVPMARRVRFEGVPDDGDMYKTGTAGASDQGPQRMLFIDASFEGLATANHEITGDGYEVNVGRLENTSHELDVVMHFATEEGGNVLQPLTILGGAENRKTAEKLRDELEKLLTRETFDIVHFAGHSVTLAKGGGTFLILPGINGEGIAVSIREITDWIKLGKSRPVFVLSSCSGSSLRTAIETMRARAKGVIGFRWDVNDRACVDYFRRFYDEYLGNKKTLPEAYCEACRKISVSKRGVPIWASAIAVVRD